MTTEVGSTYPSVIKILNEKQICIDEFMLEEDQITSVAIHVLENASCCYFSQLFICYIATSYISYAIPLCTVSVLFDQS